MELQTAAQDVVPLAGELPVAVASSSPVGCESALFRPALLASKGTVSMDVGAPGSVCAHTAATVTWETCCQHWQALLGVPDLRSLIRWGLLCRQLKIWRWRQSCWLQDRVVAIIWAPEKAAPQELLHPNTTNDSRETLPSHKFLKTIDRKLLFTGIVEVYLKILTTYTKFFWNMNVA